MNATRMAPLPPTYLETTGALHRLAVYVIAPAQRLANGEIIMRATPGGFSTFDYDGHVAGVDGDQLVFDGSSFAMNAAGEVIASGRSNRQVAAIADHLTRGELDDGLVFDAVRVRLIASLNPVAGTAHCR